jgi:hypothetical protein
MADIVTSRVFVDGEKGITAAKLNDIVASSVIQPAFYTSKPTAGTADPTDIALILKSGAYAQVPISTLGGSATQAQIWSTRLRSFNSVGNCTFECDQRNAGNSISVNGVAVDRWGISKTGTMTFTCQKISPTSGNQAIVPGTNFVISNSLLRITLTAAQASLGSGDNLQLYQVIEGSSFRELSGDVHSISLLVKSSVAGLKFSVALKDPATVTTSLVKLCTIPSAATWTLISLPNIPQMTGGNFSDLAGVAGYQLAICLAAGTAQTSSAADTWQSGNFVGAPGMNNFAASPVNSTFDIAFVQHEPGAVCSTLMDKPFSQNLDECLRYFTKTWSYPTAVGTPTGAGLGMRGLIAPSATTAGYGPVSFMKPMAKPPTVTIYNHATGAANSVRDGNGTDHASATASGVGDAGFYAVAFTTATAGATSVYMHYTADTGW